MYFSLAAGHSLPGFLIAQPFPDLFTGGF